MRPLVPLLPLLLAGVLLAACDNTVFSQGHGGSSSSDGGSTAGDGGGQDTAPPSTQDWCGVQAVFDAKCTDCHAGGSPSAGLDLSGDAYDDIVNVESSQFPGQVRVVPGKPDVSFLLSKVEATQDPKMEGNAMPPSSGLGSEYSAIIRTWIEEGATSDCDDGGDTGTIGDGGGDAYHPAGFEDPAVHGMEAKLADQVCADCHGADLTGNGDADSCDGCHESDDPDGWRGDCTFCHGGIDSSNGAPPESIRDEPTDTAFGVHTRHVTTNTHAAFDCTTCHVKPADVLSDGHLWDGTAGIAEVDFSAGLATAAEWSTTAKSCANNYCHSNGRPGAEATGSVSVSDAPLSCDSCHADSSSSSDAWEAMSGQHKHHLEAGIGCQDCHQDTVTRDGGIADSSLHVNGLRDIAIEHSDTLTFDPKGLRCDGECHREEHRSESWTD